MAVGVRVAVAPGRCPASARRRGHGGPTGSGVHRCGAYPRGIASTSPTPGGPPPARPYPALVRETLPAKAAVFAAVESILREVPLADVSVAQILERAGIARSTFYRHFASKYNVISGMLDELRGELIGVMGPWFGRDVADPEASLVEMLNGAADIWAAHQPMFRAAAENWHSDPELGGKWIQVMSDWVDEVAGQIDREREIGWAPPGVDSHTLAQTLTWSGERMLYIGGWDMCGPGGERHAVPGMVATWLGAVYFREPSPGLIAAAAARSAAR